MELHREVEILHVFKQNKNQHTLDFWEEDTRTGFVRLMGKEMQKQKCFGLMYSFW